MPRCSWGCEDSGVDHLEKHIIARTSSNARVAIRLSMSGYLSEAFAITRSMGEIANLMHLFMASEDSLEMYRNASASGRNKHFSAGKVREKLDNLEAGSFMDQGLYKNLSRAFVHTSANWSPLSYSVSDAPETRRQDELEGILTILMAVANWVSTALSWLGPVDSPVGLAGGVDGGGGGGGGGGVWAATVISTLVDQGPLSSTLSSPSW